MTGQQVAVPPSRTLAVANRDGIVVPRVIADASDAAAKRFLEFFAATFRNKNTRMAYYRAVFQFFAWCDRHRVGGIADIEPLHVAAHVENLGHSMAKPTVKQHLAAIRMLFDWLVTGQVVATNPAHSVRGPKHVVRRGKTTVLTGEQTRELLDSIDTTTLVCLRDRALISVMTFACARIGAVIAMRVDDYYPEGRRWWVRLHEKGGKRHEMSAHHNLEAYLDAYIAAAGIRDSGTTPLFRSAAGRTGVLTDKPMNRVDAY
jgi:integrase/recombinase XerD